MPRDFADDVQIGYGVRIHRETRSCDRSQHAARKRRTQAAQGHRESLKVTLRPRSGAQRMVKRIDGVLAVSAGVRVVTAQPTRRCSTNGTESDHARRAVPPQRGRRRREPAYRPATLTWKDATGTDVRIPLKVRPRGKSRREDTACEFPPLRLNFPKDVLPARRFRR